MNTIETTVSFGRDYFCSHFGVTFDKAYFENVHSRVETDQAIQRGLHNKFGEYGLGSSDPEPTYMMGYDDTLNLTLMFGGKLEYSSNLTWVKPGFLQMETIPEMKCPAIKDTWPHTQFLQHFNEAVRSYGQRSVMAPVPHGILEAAMDMCGDELLTAMVLEPDKVHHLLDILTESVIQMKEFWDMKCYGEVQKGPGLGGCSTLILSPEMVKEFLVPRYNRIASHFKDAFICNCGVSDQNMDNFLAVKDAKYVRFGWGSDLTKVAEKFQKRHIKAGLDVVRAATLPPEELKKDVLHILEKLQPVDDVSILLIHAAEDTPDENIRTIFNTVREFADTNKIKFVEEHKLSRPKGT